MKKGAKAVVIVIVVVVVAAAAAMFFLPRLLPDSPLAKMLPKPPAGAAAERRGPGRDPGKQQGEFAVPVAVATAATGPARETLLLYGSVFARKEVGIFSSVAGKVKEVRVQAGDEVGHDQILAVIDRAQAGLKFADAEVTSTIGGVVKSVLTEVGATVSPAAPLFQVVDVETVEVAVNVPEKRLGRIREGLPAEISVISYPSRVFHGTVSRLNPALDPVGGDMFPFTFDVIWRRRSDRVTVRKLKGCAVYSMSASASEGSDAATEDISGNFLAFEGEL